MMMAVFCGHYDPPIYRISDDDSDVTDSCLDCVTDELRFAMPVGKVVHWKIERNTDYDEEDGPDSAAELLERGPR